MNLPSFETLGYWRPKVYEPRYSPSYDDLVDLLRALKTYASEPTYEMFSTLARCPPVDRLLHAFSTTIRILREDPDLICSRCNLAPYDIFSFVLEEDEFESLVEVHSIPSITNRQKKTAEGLLCLEDRASLAHFLSKSFKYFDNKAYIHPMEEI